MAAGKAKQHQRKDACAEWVSDRIGNHKAARTAAIQLVSCKKLARNKSLSPLAKGEARYVKGKTASRPDECGEREKETTLGN